MDDPMQNLKQSDPTVNDLIKQEARRQRGVLRMIASENFASAAVMEASGSILSNKYSEGYPGARYYKGQQVIDTVEQLAIDRAKALFDAEHVNVQPYSGSPANMAVYLGLLGTCGKVLGMDLAAGGHLTHGAKVSFSGKYYENAYYGVDHKTERIDLTAVRELARSFRPDMIICGASSYPRVIDFAGFAEIAKEVGAFLLADIAHISGLCITGEHPNPCPHADVATTTIHKMLRGPRAGMILCKKELAAKIDKAVFPGLQGGPHNATIAGVAVAMSEAAKPDYAAYCRQVVKNAKALAHHLIERGFRLVTGGTDNHMLLFDATAIGLTGNVFATALDNAGIVTNINKIPFDPRKANDPSGVRLGTAALTTQKMQEAEMETIARMIHQVAQSVDDETTIKAIRDEVREFCAAFPPPGF